MIYFTDWRLDATGDIIARQYDNQSRTITITGALPEGWTWELLVRAGDAYDEWPMTAQDGSIGCTLTAEMLAVSGYYTLQLRGKQGEMVRHTNTIRVFIPESLSGDAQWPELPTAFSDAVDRAEDAADRAEAAAVHQPMISDAKTWLVWDADKGEYVDTGVSAGGGENADWNESDESSPRYIQNRTHYTYVQEAIAATDICTFKTSNYMVTNISLTTSLVTSLEYNVYRNNVKVCTSECTIPEGSAFRQIALDSGVFNVPLDTPSIGYYNGPSSNAQYRIERASADAKTIVHPLDVKYIPDAAKNLGLTNAKAGQVPVVSAVDASGVPTAWETRKAVNVGEAGVSTDIPTLEFLANEAAKFFYKPFPLGIGGAKVGQIAKIAAVDATGMPTAWSPVDMPSGGEGQASKAWTHIRDVDLATDVLEAFVSTTDADKTFAYDEILLEFIPDITGYFYVRADRSSVRSNNVQFWVTNAKYTQIHLGLINKRLAITAVFRTDGSLGFSNNYGGALELDKISALMLGVSSSVESSFTVKIWGR